MKLFKQIFCIILAILSLTLVGCSQNSEEKTYDEAFLKDLTKGLINRWDESDAYDADPIDPTEVHLEKLVKIELDAIEQYKDKKFEDSLLQEKAISYINLLKKQQEALSYYDSDYLKYDKLWAEAYDARTQTIKDFIETYNLEFPKKHEETVKSMLTNAKLADENEAFEKSVEEIEKNIVFNKVKTSYSYSYYEAIVENTTDKTFDSFSVDISLLDGEGIIIENEYDSVSNLRPGQKAKLEFMTDADFASYEISVDYYVKED